MTAGHLEADAADRVRALHGRLEGEYGAAERARFRPLDELMLTILSQNTTDANRDRAFEALQERYPDWYAVRDAPREEVEETIRSAGLWRQKARVIQETLERLTRERGTLDLSHLEDLSDQEALDYLTDFRGIGIKTAACVLCFSLERPYMPVDTHVHRVSRRLGLVPQKATADRAHLILNGDDVVPVELRFSFHIQLIRHGRAICGPRRPACDSCVIEDLCPQVGVEASRSHT